MFCLFFSHEASVIVMGVLSKLDQIRAFGSTLTFRHYGPGMGGLIAFFVVIKWYSKIAKASRSRVFVTKSGQPTKDRAHVDGEFLKKLWRIIRILIPSLFSTEVTLDTLRSKVSNGLFGTPLILFCLPSAIKNIRSIISRDQLWFLMNVVLYILAMPAISVTNAIIKFGLSELKLMFRERLTKCMYEKYLKGFIFYKMSNLDNRIQNADQLLTQDVDKFCEGLVELYSNLTKGHNRERTTVLASFANLIGHLRKVILFRFSIGFVDNIVAKYLATVVGWYAVSRPFFNGKNTVINKMTKNELIQEYYNSGRMMLKLAEALGRLALAGREMTRLSGFTTRVDTLLKVLDDLDNGSYQRSMISDTTEEVSKIPLRSLDPGTGELIIQDNLIRFENVPLVTPNGDVLIKNLDLEVPSGRNVLVCGPNGCGKSSLFRVLGELWPLFGGRLTKPAKGKLFYIPQVPSGRNVLVCGPNGCGKSSLFRVLGELWPLFGGRLTKPAKGKLFYIPQRPYMTLGTLRDQIIYPDRHFDMIKKGHSDKDLEGMLENVQLSYILSREGGWNAVQDWMDVLSGGEKQRIAMARLFYHKPQFAILDECTSAVSVDVEGAMYKICREMGITLFTVSHRKSLWIHHDYFLHMDGRGSYKFDKITDETTIFGT
ncbi:ABC transporter, ATP-binding protein [Dictyocaulus viviparus]|uniref:ABC transporter, ATP-binding protein n=1 Tax=Dictyocaulus viviparus TaxID=29172 RepID=A0A0D8XIU4_DICVI|nr:ABC transporter, ATP-binding protein [Dictyocaulus viviparus]